MTAEEKYKQQRADNLAAMEAKVNDLIRRGHKRRAATLCLDLMEAADTNAERQKFSQMRGMLIRSSCCIREQT
jgi:low affinity Fe/Cu permease